LNSKSIGRGKCWGGGREKIDKKEGEMTYYIYKRGFQTKILKHIYCGNRNTNSRCLAGLDSTVSRRRQKVTPRKIRDTFIRVDKRLFRPQGYRKSKGASAIIAETT